MDLTYSTPPTLTMLVGVSYSGKSYFAQQLSRQINAKVLSSDQLRKELYGDEETQEHNQELFEILHKRIKQYLMSGISVIYDATNLNSKRREAFLKELESVRCNKACVIVATPIEVLKNRAKKRQRVVPWSVVESQIKNFNCPHMSEGWDYIWIKDSGNVTKSKAMFRYLKLFAKLGKSIFIKHDNPNHSKTIGCHMISALRYYWKNYCPVYSKYVVSNAVLFHDIGKPFCKSFENTKGIITEKAHFYSHENASSYIWIANSSLFNDTSRLTVGALINWHMKPYLMSEKSLLKFCNKVRGTLGGNMMIKMLSDIHECDKSAH